MKFCVLASGSKGNSTYVSSTNTNILIDIGTSCLYIEKKLDDLNIKPKEIKAIVLTHIHVDHTNGLKVFIKKYNPIIYLTEKMYKELNYLKNYVIIEDDFMIDDIKVGVIKTSHDVDSNGYIIENSNKSLVYITDTGYINKKNHSKLTNKTAYVMESNHDIEMLQNGKYPYHLKQRILGDKGHLSNDSSASYLHHFIGDNTKTIVLVHISDENNTEEKALKTLSNKLKDTKYDTNIIISTQKDRTELIEL